MKAVIMAVLFLACQTSTTIISELDTEWDQFKSKYNKYFSSIQEECKRKSIFLKHKKIIEEHNSADSKKKPTFKLRMNAYADMHHHEFNRKMKGYIRDKKIHARKKFAFNYNCTSKMLKRRDWRGYGAVSEVENQGNCGSCWAFSAVGALEAANYFRTGRLVRLSKQHLLDCSQGNSGCDGGLMTLAYDYVIANNGIEKEECYPYEGKKVNFGRSVLDYVEIPKGNENLLQQAVCSSGPVSAAVNAKLASFRFYGEGIYNDPTCTQHDVTHAILIVGYGTDKKTGLDYWILKNSWGKDWGESGYMKLLKSNNSCGIATYASHPTFKPN